MTSQSPAFWEGYKAFVYGGRRQRTVYKKTGIWEGYDGLEPFDHFTSQQRDDWNADIEYGRKERDECSNLRSAIKLKKQVRRGRK